MTYPAIADHGLIGDLQSAALVATDGTVDWFCCPRTRDRAAPAGQTRGLICEDETWSVNPSAMATGRSWDMSSLGDEER
jgi:hypothetical protein